MAPGKPRDPRKEQQWRCWIQQWHRSGLSVRDFCARQALAQPSFYSWRRTLQQRDAARFVPVRVVADEQPAHRQGVEVVLAGSRTLRVVPGIAAPTILCLIALLD